MQQRGVHQLVCRRHLQLSTCLQGSSQRVVSPA